MKEKIAYLRGLIDGIGIADDSNGRVIRAIVDCLDAMAEEVEMNSARLDNTEKEITVVKSSIDDLDEIIDFLCDEEADDCDCDCDCGCESELEDEDWEDNFDFFTCPDCGEIVMLDDEMLTDNKKPICPKCNKPLFNDDCE